MKKVKVITVGSGAQNVVNNKKAAKRFDVFAIDSVEGSGNDEAKGRVFKIAIKNETILYSQPPVETEHAPSCNFQ